MKPLRLSRQVMLMPNPGRVAESETIYLVGAPSPPASSSASTGDGDSRPSLVTEEAVLSALRHLARGRSPVHSPLAGLEVVRRRLIGAGLVPSIRARHYEVGRLLDELAAVELDRMRRQAGLAWRTPSDGEPAARLVADFGQDLPELEAWSALHYLYLAPGYSLTLDDIAALLGGRHRRTLQRRLARGVAALTARLFDLERGALDVQRPDRAAAFNPSATGATLNLAPIHSETVRRVAEAARERLAGERPDLGTGLIIVVVAAGSEKPNADDESL